MSIGEKIYMLRDNTSRKQYRAWCTKNKIRTDKSLLPSSRGEWYSTEQVCWDGARVSPPRPQRPASSLWTQRLYAGMYLWNLVRVRRLRPYDDSRHWFVSFHLHRNNNDRLSVVPRKFCQGQSVTSHCYCHREWREKT